MDQEQKQKLQAQIDPQFGELLFFWTMDEFHRHERSTIWYAVFLILGVLLIVFAVLSSNYIFAIFLVLFGLFSVVQHFRDPEDVPVMIFTTGLVVGDHYHEWSEVKDFSIVYEPPEVRRLYVDFHKITHPCVSLQLPEAMDPNDLRETLLTFATENLDRDREQLTDILARRYKL